MLKFKPKTGPFSKLDWDNKIKDHKLVYNIIRLAADEQIYRMKGPNEVTCTSSCRSLCPV